MTLPASAEVRELLFELVGQKPDEFVQQRRQPDGSTTSYVVRSKTCLLGRVHALLEPGRGAPKDRPGKTSRKQPAAPLPVQTEAFDLIVLVHSGARWLEHELRVALGLPPSFADAPHGLARGGSFAHTCRALANLPGLLDQLEARNPAHRLVTGPPRDPDRPGDRKPGKVLAEVSRWHRAAETLVGFRQEWARLRYVVVTDPAAPGAPGKRKRAGCPYCASQSLKQRPRDGAVVCCNPTCKTPAGDRATWSIDDLTRLGYVLTTEPEETSA